MRGSRGMGRRLDGGPESFKTPRRLLRTSGGRAALVAGRWVVGGICRRMLTPMPQVGSDPPPSGPPFPHPGRRPGQASPTAAAIPPPSGRISPTSLTNGVCSTFPPPGPGWARPRHAAARRWSGRPRCRGGSRTHWHPGADGSCRHLSITGSCISLPGSRRRP